MPKMIYQCCDCCHEFVKIQQKYEANDVQYCPKCEIENTKWATKRYSFDCGSGGVTP